MRTSTSCWIALLGAGPLFAAQAPAPPPTSPTESRPLTPGTNDGSLPPPRPITHAMPSGPIVEEPAPAPHEQPSAPGTLQTPPQFHEEAAPMPRDQTQPPARFWMPNAPRDPSPPDVGSLRRELDNMRREREALLAENIDLIGSKEMRAAKNNEANLRMRVAELLVKAAQAKKENEKATAPPSPTPKGQGSGVKGQGPEVREHRSEDRGQGPEVTPVPSIPGKPPQTSQSAHPSTPVKPDDTAKRLTDAPIDPLALAQSLFRARDFAAALNAYRKLDKEDPNPEDRIVVQYMMACCLRKLGKMDEASVLYREAANSPGNDFLMENAQWYLRTMKDRRELEALLDELRQRRQAVKTRKP